MMDDDRAVSIVVGGILLFAIGVVLLGVLQTTAVPLSNEEVEFDHAQGLQTEFLDLRTAALTAAQDGEIRSTEVTLGARYPTRFIMLNPPPASGTLRTTDPGEVSINRSVFSPSDVCGIDGQVESRSLVYEANYNEYDQEPTVGFEHGASFRKHEDGSPIVDGAQRLVNGNTITLLPLVEDYYESGVDTRAIDLASHGMNTTTVDATSEGFALTVPSNLDKEIWEDSDALLADELEDGPLADVEAAGPGKVRLEFPPGTYQVRCAALGFEKPPEDVSPPDPDDGDNDDGSGISINPPASQGTLVLEDAVTKDDQCKVRMTYENPTSSDITITRARINFYHLAKPGGNDDGPPAGRFVHPEQGNEMTIGGDFASANSIEIGSTHPNDQQDIDIEFTELDVPNSDTYFVLTMEFEDIDRTSTYFVEHSINEGNPKC